MINYDLAAMNFGNEDVKALRTELIKEITGSYITIEIYLRDSPNQLHDSIDYNAN